MLLDELQDGGTGVGDTAGADVHVDIGRDAQGVGPLHVLGDLGDLLGHAIHVGQDLVCGLLQPSGLAGVGARGDGEQRNVLAGGQDAHQAAFLIASPRNLVGQGVDLVAGGLALAGIQGLAGQTGGAHLLRGVAVAVADALDLGVAGLAGHVRTRQVGAVVVDDLRQTSLVVGVVGDGLRAGVGLGTLGEQVQSGQLRILDIVGLGLHVVQLTSKEHRGILGAVEASALRCHDRIGDGRLQKGPHLRTIVVGMLLHLSYSSFFPYAPVLSSPGFHLLSEVLYFRT